MKRVLAIPAFRRLAAVTVLDEIAVSLSSVALALLVYRRTGSAFGATGFFLCAVFGPAFLSPAFVSRLDQRSVRGALGGIYLCQALISLLLAWLVLHFSVVSVLALVLLNGSLGIAARVLARSAWTSTTTPMGLLREANAVVNSSLSVCYMLGPALGGAVVAAGGTRAALFVNVGVFLLMAATVATASGLPKAVTDPTPSRGRLRAAFARVRAAPLLRRLIGLQAVAMAFFTLSIPVDVVLARHVLHTGAGGYGALLAAWGAGTVVGSGLYARWRGSSSRLLMSCGTVLMGLGFLGMAVAPTLSFALLGAAIGGTGNGVEIVAMRSALQETIPDGWIAPILSLNEAIFQAIPGLGILIGGGIAAVFGARVTFAVAAVGSLFVAALVWSRLAGSRELVIPRSDPRLTGAGSDEDLVTSSIEP